MNLGKSALNITAAQATGTHVHPAGSTVHDHADALDIGSPDTMTLAVGMADIIAVHRAFFANLTKLTHGNPPPYGVLHIKLVYYITVKMKMQEFFSLFREKTDVRRKAGKD